MNKYLKCEDCDKEDKTVCSTTCPYADEIDGIEVEVDLCPDCYEDRAMEIQEYL